VPTQTVDVGGARFAYLFFSRTTIGQAAARNYLKRLKERSEDLDKATSLITQLRRIKAIRAWGKQAPSDLGATRQPVLVANGDHDVMVPSSNSVDLARRLPNSRLRIYDDAGHGGAFQYHEEFVPEVLKLLGPLMPTTVPSGSLVRGLDAGAPA
jgi:pimeloyl-ACP methyl ester carboxylesterase